MAAFLPFTHKHLHATPEQPASNGIILILMKDVPAQDAPSHRLSELLKFSASPRTKTQDAPPTAVQLKRIDLQFPHSLRGPFGSTKKRSASDRVRFPHRTGSGRSNNRIVFPIPHPTWRLVHRHRKIVPMPFRIEVDSERL